MKSRVCSLWKMRQPREKWLLATLAALLLLTLLWQSVEAARRFDRQMQQHLLQTQARLAAMQPLAAKLEKRLARERQHSSPAWQDRALQLAVEQGLPLRMESRDRQRLTFSAAIVSLPPLLHWLRQLEQEWAVPVRQLELERSSAGIRLLKLELRRDE